MGKVLDLLQGRESLWLVVEGSDQVGISHLTLQKVPKGRNLPSASYAIATLEYPNDVIRHMNGGQRLKDAQSTTSIACVFSWSNADTSAKVISADVMSQFIAMHNLSFKQLSDLVSAMFPDSKLFSCKHTKAIICDAIESHLKVSS